MIILGTIVFLFLEQLKSIVDVNVPKEAERNADDIIIYANRNLTWQEFNYILMLTPCLLISFESKFHPLTDNENPTSWTPLMIALIVIHFLKFLALHRIIVVKEKD